MTNNSIMSQLRSGSQGNYYGLPTAFAAPIDCQTGAIVTGPILGKSEILITGNVAIVPDPLPDAIKPSGTLTVAGATTLNGVVAINAATSITGATQITGVLNVSGTVTAPTFAGNINVQSWKGFDIKHPNKENHRLRHICAEGPEAGVYIRGRLKDSNAIQLPEYWNGLVDYDSITVQLQPIGERHYHLNVMEIDKEKIVVKDSDDKPVDCFYHVWASRIDGEPLIVEYEGETPAEYPGDDKQFSISGYDYDKRGG